MALSTLKSSLSRRALLSLLLVISAAAAFVPGCGDNDEATQPTSTSLPLVSGAVVPETAEEGQSIDIQIWGTRPDARWSLTGFEIGPTSGDIIEIRPVGGHDSGTDPGVSEFSAVATLPPCTAGPRTIRIHGSNGRIDFPIHILPRNMLVRYTAEGRGAGNETLMIAADGWAVAFRRGDVPPVRVSLPAEQVERIRGLFVDAGFMDLDDRYVSDPRTDSLLCKIVYNPDAEHHKRVVAEPSQAPVALLSLIDALHQLTGRILDAAPPPLSVTGDIEIRPQAGEVGSVRTIVLTLRNRASEAVTLHFPSTQLYDVAVIGAAPRDSMCGGNGGGNGGGGNGGGHSSGPSDPPPMHAVIWNWAHGRTFEPTLSEIVLQPGEERTTELEWPGTDNEGVPVPIGEYQIMARIPAEQAVPVAPAHLVVGNPTPPLVLRFAVEPRSAPQGAQRTLQLSIGNPGPDPVELVFSSAQIYDFMLDDPMTMMPGWDWRWSEGKGFPAVVTPLTIPAEGRIEFSEPWDGRLTSGRVLRPGTYTMQAMLMLLDRPMTPTVEIQVTR
jgi:hypothetical protein